MLLVDYILCSPYPLLGLILIEVVPFQLHYNLGKTLYSICEGKDVGNTIFLIASQINHGKEFIETDDTLRIPVAKLNMKAGKMAFDGCDHKMAYHYFVAALSLLPDDSWESNYDLSLRLNFMTARAANSSCRYDEAELTLRTIFERARCLNDKLPSYFLLVTSECYVLTMHLTLYESYYFDFFVLI